MNPPLSAAFTSATAVSALTSQLALLAQPAAGEEGPGILAIFLQSGTMAKFILLVLLLFSLASWAVIFAKWAQFRRAEAHSRRFLETFHRSKRFSEVSAVTNKVHASPMVGIFQTGYAEIDAQMKTGEGTEAPRMKLRSLPALERSLQRAIHLELTDFSRWTSFLATTAAATPFIGLFGTVWGIMVAFRDIGVSGSTSITVVAPGIAEALVNTAAGLAAAIPALIAYNYFASRTRNMRGRMEDFALELLNLSERNFT